MANPIEDAEGIAVIGLVIFGVVVRAAEGPLAAGQEPRPFLVRHNHVTCTKTEALPSSRKLLIERWTLRDLSPNQGSTRLWINASGRA